MAITRAQIARELYIKGGVVNPDGRRGFFKGAEQDSKDKGTNISPGTVGSGDNMGSRRDDNPYAGADGPKGPPSELNPPPVTIPKSKPEETELNKIKRTVKKFSPFKLLDAASNSKLARINNAMQRQKYIDGLDLDIPEEKEEYDRIMNQLGGLGMDIIGGPKDLESTMLSVPPSMLATNPMTQFKKVDGVSTLGNPGVDDVLGEGYEEYLDRFKTTDGGGGGGDQQQTDPCLGPNPPAYCAVNNDPTDPVTPTRNLGGLAPRFAGSIFDFTGLADGGRAGAMDGGRMMMDDDPTGGIMDLESGRQMYFLGKLVKKVTRGVKKIVKSPVGKMALLGLGAGMAGFGPASGLFGSGKGLAFKQFLMGGKTLPPSMGFKSKGLLGSVLDYAKSNPYKTIGGLSLFSGLMTPKEDDDKFNIDDYYKTNRLNIADVRNNPYNYLSAANQGSRYNVADGGIMRNGYAEGSKEPVAKKTMPLLDMDGQEMDLREEGGFVPLGRMERADDVPARLSKNEFVFTADAVRNAGEGDVDKGAEVMYNMMKNLESGGEVSEESQGLEGAREMFKTSQRLEEVI